jgi:anaerobic ribonucleoside-triphosphate reductase activating protein
MNIRMHSIAYPVTALGHGLRVVLWVAGCAKRCPGCISGHILEADSGTFVDTGALAARLAGLREVVSGITISGGEPFEQAPALAELLELLRETCPEWNVQIYSGLLIGEIQRHVTGGPALLALADVLVDGPYVQAIPQRHPLAGSGNQVIHYLSERGLQLRKAIERMPLGQFNIAYGKSEYDLLIGVGGREARATAHEIIGSY